MHPPVCMHPVPSSTSALSDGCSISATYVRMYILDYLRTYVLTYTYLLVYLLTQVLYARDKFLAPSGLVLPSSTDLCISASSHSRLTFWYIHTHTPCMVHTCMRACVHTRARSLTHARTRPLTHARTRTHPRTHPRTCMHAYIHTTGRMSMASTCARWRWMPSRKRRSRWCLQTAC